MRRPLLIRIFIATFQQEIQQRHAYGDAIVNLVEDNGMRSF